jgi:ParB family transcriptional regulator, chromosome partitioning protein
VSDKKRGLPETVRMRHGSHFVEELTNRDDKSIGKLVPLSAVIPDPDQPRSAMGDLSELVSSIQHVGVLEPILVRPLNGSTNGVAASVGQSYKIISGERRFRASMEAGLSEIPVIVMDVAEDEALEIALIENLQRKDLTPFEEAEGFRALAERFGYTHEKISQTVGKSRTVVTESFALLQVPPVVREAANALGVTTKSILLELLKVESPEEMILLLEEVAGRGLSRDDLRRRLRTDKKKDGTERKRPFIFQYRPTDQSFKLSLKFRESDVSQADIVSILKKILEEIEMGTSH